MVHILDKLPHWLLTQTMDCKYKQSSDSERLLLLLLLPGLKFHFYCWFCTPKKLIYIIRAHLLQRYKWDILGNDSKGVLFLELHSHWIDESLFYVHWFGRMPNSISILSLFLQSKRICLTSLKGKPSSRIVSNSLNN